MAQIKGNGPFHPTDYADHVEGVTILEWYAGQALAGLCANPGGPIQKSDMRGWAFANSSEDRVAIVCFDLAEAMIAEAKKRQG